MYEKKDEAPRFCLEARKALLTEMLESGAKLPTPLPEISVHDGLRSARPHQLEINAFAKSEIERLQLLKCRVLAEVRGVLISPDVFDLIFGYLPWWSTVALTANQQATLAFALDQRRIIAEQRQALLERDSNVKAGRAI